LCQQLDLFSDAVVAIDGSKFKAVNSSDRNFTTHFLTKGLERVKTEMSLHVLAYNLKRLMTVLGIANMMEAIRALCPFTGPTTRVRSRYLAGLAANAEKRRQRP
jgi:hypothetical protein